MSTRRLVLGLIASLAGLSHAQRVPQVIGLLLPWKEAIAGEVHADLVRAMLALGYAPPLLNIVLRTADSENSRLPARTDELVKFKVGVIVAAGANAVVAARRASSTIPIVFWGVADPVASGLAESLARPGRNNTGFTNFSAGELAAKRFELLRQLMPEMTRAAYLMNPVSETGNTEKSVRELGDKFGFRGLVVRASSLQELEAAFQAIIAFQAQVVFIQIDSFFQDVQSQIVELLLRNRLASVWQQEGPVEVGGLMSYGSDGSDIVARVASYVDKILRGVKASELPIQQPTKLNFVINRTTAAAIGLKIPQVLLLQADRVVE
jgi:putative ABC transport system substrate-binding protein